MNKYIVQRGGHSTKQYVLRSRHGMKREVPMCDELLPWAVELGCYPFDQTGLTVTPPVTKHCIELPLNPLNAGLPFDS